MQLEVIITKHAMSRRKRLGLSKKAFTKIAQKAFEEGLKHKELKGGARKLYDSIWLRNNKINNIRSYHDFIYLFSGNVLVTVFQPKNNNTKRKLRNINKSR